MLSIIVGNVVNVVTFHLIFVRLSQNFKMQLNVLVINYLQTYVVCFFV